MPEPAASPIVRILNQDVGRYHRWCTPSILEHQERGAGNEIQLTDAMAKAIGLIPFHGVRFSGQRFDCGSKVGYLEANIAFALQREDMSGRVRQVLAKYAESRKARQDDDDRAARAGVEADLVRG